MQEILYMTNVFLNVPAAVEYQEQKSNENIDRVVKIKTDYMEFYK